MGNQDRERYDLVLIDFGHLAYRTLFASQEEEEFKLWKSIVFGTLLSNVWKFPTENMVLAAESYGNWRKEVYEDYKGNRKAGRDESPVDFDEFFDVLGRFEDSLRRYLPFIFMKVPHAEGDDIVGTLAIKNQDKKVLIVSGDKDFQHLQMLPNVSQYDPIKKKMVKCPDPQKFLLEMLLMGDAGDNIPSVRPRIGPKTAAKIAKDGLDGVKFFVQKEGLVEEYQRNLKLISLFHIPPQIKKSILDEYQSYQKPVIDLRTFLIENELWKWKKDTEFRRTESMLMELY
jgi:5'-3' exonuclease